LLHGGAHKTNQVLGQALLTKRMGKTRVIAETGAGQHGVATALASALFGFKCRIYMGAKDVERQKPNVFRMELMGAEVVPVTAGSGTLKEACNAALRNWAESFEDTHYMLGTAAGPHPFPTIVREFQKVIGEEARAQFAEAENGLLPDAVIALRAGGVLAVEYKSRGVRMDDPHDIPGSLRPKDLLQTVIGAMVLSASEGVACAPVLRTNNAVYFLRPGKTLATLLAERIGAAVSFVKPYAERSGISASDYAELCVVPAQMLSGRPVRSEGDLRGEAAHARMLR